MTQEHTNYHHGRDVEQPTNPTQLEAATVNTTAPTLTVEQELQRTKKHNLRSYFDFEYPINSGNSQERIDALVTLLYDIETPDNVVASIFRNDGDALKLAQTSPASTLNTAYEVRHYYKEYIPDAVYKAVKGQFPEGRATIHDIHKDDCIPPLTVSELTKIYGDLGKNQDEPLLNLATMESLIVDGEPGDNIIIKKALNDAYQRHKTHLAIAGAVGGIIGITANILCETHTLDYPFEALSDINRYSGAASVGLAFSAIANGVIAAASAGLISDEAIAIASLAFLVANVVYETGAVKGFSEHNDRAETIHHDINRYTGAGFIGSSTGLCVGVAAVLLPVFIMNMTKNLALTSSDAIQKEVILADEINERSTPESWENRLAAQEEGRAIELTALKI